MKATELRIGNIVRHPTTEGALEYKEYPIEFRHLLVADLLNPIPLTEEWFLTKTNFKIEEIYREGNGLKRFSDGIMWFDFKDGEPISITIYQALKKQVKIKYIHQFQNWYFSNVGEEPIITTGN